MENIIYIVDERSNELYALEEYGVTILLSLINRQPLSKIIEKIAKESRQTFYETQIIVNEFINDLVESEIVKKDE
ncbi:MAG: hypothetical protein UH654_04685 [Lachnospiraceae bacterium]|nr:hypothetical protein [Lachnospiraceae bacterium]